MPTNQATNFINGGAVGIGNFEDASRVEDQNTVTVGDQFVQIRRAKNDGCTTITAFEQLLPDPAGGIDIKTACGLFERQQYW